MARRSAAIAAAVDESQGLVSASPTKLRITVPVPKKGTVAYIDRVRRRVEVAMEYAIVDMVEPEVIEA
jgi:hypothetical protein